MGVLVGGWDEGGMGESTANFSMERVVRAVEKVRERLLRATAALEKAGIRYAVAGGNAVALWVSTVDEAAVRNTADVDVLVEREDLAAVRNVLEGAGFVYRHVGGLDVFLDGEGGKVREAVHLVFARELVRVGEPAVNPGVDQAVRLKTESGREAPFRVLELGALVQIKLTAFRDKDRTHLRDLIELGLIDATWVDRLGGEASVLGGRLRMLLEDPNG
jgi:hypothetical protein